MEQRLRVGSLDGPSRGMRNLTHFTLWLFLFGQQQMVMAGTDIIPTKGNGWTTSATTSANTTEITGARQIGGNSYNSFQHFGVAAGQTVNFSLGNTDNLVNLVRASRTDINGILNAYKNGAIGGNVFFVNPHGITVGASGVVNVGSLSMVVPTQSAMNDYITALEAGGSSVNGPLLFVGGVQLAEDGEIDIKGTINAQGGVLLLANNVNVSGSVNAGESNSGVASYGSINDSGAELFAALVKVSDDFQDELGIFEVDGEIVIMAGNDFANTGNIRVDGASHIDAGTITVKAKNNITLSADSSISARGRGENSDGGEIIVVANRNATIADNAVLDASAGTTGDGGFVEFSAKETVELAGGSLQAGAQNGEQGTVLIDPLNLVVSTDILRSSTPASSDGVTWNAGNLILDADEKITITSDKVVSTRQVALDADVEAHKNDASTGDSGNLTLRAQKIELQSGSMLLAQGDGDDASGAILLEASDSAGVLGGGAEADITIDGATIKGSSVTMTATATGDDTLNIAAIGSVTANIDIDNATIIADGGDVSATAAANTTATAAGTPFDLAVDEAIVDLTSSAAITVDNSSLDALVGNVALASSSTVETSAVANASADNADATADAAYAVTNIDSTVSVLVGDGSQLKSGINTSLTASTDITATTTADGTSGGATAAGATVAVASIDTTTAVALNDTVDVDATGDLLMSASSTEVLTTRVKSTAGGASDNSDSTKAELIKEGREAETSEGGVSVAGALAVTDLSSATTAMLNVNAVETVNASTIDLTATSERMVETEANASATGGATGVGVAVGITVADVTTRAEVKNNAQLETTALAVKALKGSATSSIKTSSISGAGATNVGVAGSLALSVVNNRNEAIITNGSVVNIGNTSGSLTLTSESDIETTVTAKSTQQGDDGKVGVGASVAVNVANTDAIAEIEDAAVLTGAGDVALSATGSSTVETEAQAGSAGGIAVSPVVGVTVANSESRARLGAGTQLGAGIVSVTASQSGSVKTTTGADAAGDNVGVGASLAVTVANDTATAVTDRDINATDAVTFEASSDTSSTTIAKATAKGAEGANGKGDAKAGDSDVNTKIDEQVAFGESKSDKPATNTDDADASTSEGGVSVAAAIAVNVGNSTTTAMIPDARTVESGGVVTVRSVNAMDASASADGTQVSGAATNVGVGAAVALNVAKVNNSARIGNATVTGAGVTVEALMVKDATSEFNADATSGAGASRVGVAGALALNVGNASSQAVIASGANVTVTGAEAVTLGAESATGNKAIAKSTQEGESDVGVGASVAVNVANTDAIAEIEDTAVLTGAGDVTLSATGSSSVETEAQAGSAGGVAVSPVVGVTVANSESLARLGAGTQLGAGIVSVTASQSGSVKTTTGADAAGDNVGVGASLAVTVANDTATAVTDRDINATGAVTFEASSDTSSTTIAKATAKGAKESDDEGNNQAGDKDVNGKIDEQVAFGESKSDKAATNTDDADASTSEGGVSVAAAIAVNVGNSTTTATIPDTRTVESGGAVTVRSVNAMDASASADGTQVSGAATNVGVGAAVALNVANVTNRARIGDADVTAAGVTVEALMVDNAVGENETSEFNADATSGAGASGVGVAGALALNVGNASSEAVIASAATVTVTDTADVIINAENNSTSTVKAKSIQEGDDAKVGVGASVALNIAVNDTRAEIENDAEVTGANSISLSASSESAATTEAEAGSAGGVAVSPVVALTVASNETLARLGSDGDLAPGNVLTQTGSFSATAVHKGSATTQSSADAAGGNVGVGASLAVTVATDTVSAVTDRDMQADGDISFVASSDVASDTTAKASAKGGKEANDDGSNQAGDKDVNGKIDEQVTYGETKSGKTNSETDKADASSSEGGVSVAAAIGVNVGVSSTTAMIPQDRVIVAGGDLTVRSSNVTDAGVTADGTQVAGESTNVGVGAAVAVNVATVTNVASIEDNANVTAGGVTVEALMVKNDKGESEISDFKADANSGAGSSKVGVAGSLATHVGVTNTEAVIRDADVTITDAGDINDGNDNIGLTAENNSASTVKAKATQEGAGGKVGVGASVAVNVGVNDTVAEIEDNASLTDGADLSVTATAEHDMTTTAEAGAAGGVAVTPVVAVAVGINETRARVGAGNDLNLTGNMAINGSSKGKVTTSAEGQAKGDVAVGVAISIGVPQNNVSASLERGGSIGGTLDIAAISELTVETEAKAGAKGASDDKSKNGGSSNELVSQWKGSATPEGEDTPDAARAEVDDPDETVAETESSSSGEKPGTKTNKKKTEVQVAGAIGVNVIGNDASAGIADGVHITEVGNTTISSSNDVNFTTYATGEAVSDATGVGAAIALTVVDNDSVASVGNGATIDQAGDLNLSSATSQNMGDDFTTKVGTEAKAGASGGKVAVAGSVAIVNTANSSKAFIGDDAEIGASGNVSVSAVDQSKLSARAWSGALSKSKDSKAGVGAAFSVLHANDETHAYIGKRAKLLDALSLLVSAENKKVDISDFEFKFDFEKRSFDDFSYDDLSPINVLSSNNYYTEAAAGAASTSDSGVAVAGAFSVQVLESTTMAYIDDDAEIITQGKTDVSARRDTNAVALGGAFGGSKKVGVGVTLANINSLDKTQAYIGKRAKITTTNDDPAAGVTVDADSDQLLGTIGLSGAVASGGGGAGVAVNGVLAAAVSVKTTEAYIDDDAVVKTHGSLAVNADSDSDVYMLSGGVSAAGKVAVGGSLAANVMVDSTRAYIGSGADVSAKGSTDVKADADEVGVTAVVSGGVGGKVGVVGSVSVNAMLTTTEAYIGEAALLNTDGLYDSATQAVTVSAADNSVVVGVAGAGAGGGSAGVGASIDTTVFNKDVLAHIDGGAEVKAGDDITVKADSDESAVSVTAAIAGGGKAGVGGAISIMVSTNETRATIADDLAGKATVVNAGGDVSVDADDDITTVVIAGSGAGGGTAGVGGSLGVTTLFNTTAARIGNNADVDAGENINVTADANETLVTTVVGGAGGGTAGVAATISVAVIKTTTEASVGTLADLDAGQSVTISALDDTDVVGVAGAAAGGGTAGVGAASDTGIFIKNTRAFVDDGATVDATAGDIALTATAKEVHVSTAIGLAGGGSVGVGGSIATSVSTNNTEAYTVGNAALAAGSNINIAARDDSTTVAVGGAGSGGGAAGVAGSLAVVVNTNTTSAYTGSGSILDANKAIDVKANSSENVITTVVTGSGGGSAGVAGSVGVKVLNTTTQAYLGTGSQVNQNAAGGSTEQTLNVAATDKVVTVGVAGAGAGGGGAGVGAGADVSIVRNTTTAYIGDGSNVDVDGDVSVSAKSDKYVNSFSGAGAGGGAAGVAGAASVIVVGALLDKQAQSGLSGEDDSGNSGSTQDYADEQTSGSLVGGMLGDSTQATKVSASLDEETAKIEVSDDFNDTTSVDLKSTQAFIGPSATVDAGQDITVEAEDKTLAIIGTAAGAGGGAAGVAGAVAVALVHDAAEAFVGHDAKINAGRDTLVRAGTKDDIFAAGLTGSGAGAAAVNGVALVTVVNSDTSAYIADDAEVNQELADADSVSVEADSTTNVINLGGSGGGAGAAAVGGVADVAVISKSTKAFIARNAKVHAQNDIAVEAESAEQLVSGSIAIFGAGAAAVNGVAAVVVVDNETEAFIGDSAVVDSDGNVKLAAVDDTLLITVAGSGSGAGAAGVTGAVSVNTITNSTRAYVSDSAIVNAGGNAAGTEVYTGELGTAETSLAAGAWDDGRMIDVDGDGEADVDPVEKNPDMDSDGVADGDVSNGAEFNVSNGDDAEDNPSVSGVGIGVKETQARTGLSITALSNEKITNVVAGVAGAGAAAVAGTAVVNVIATNTEASIGASATINQAKGGAGQAVSLSATDNTEMLQIGGTVAGAGAAGVSGSANTAIVTKTTTATVGDDTIINAGGGVAVNALSAEDMTLITANVSGAGAAGVGGAVGVGVVSNTTQALLGQRVMLDSGGNMLVAASSDSVVEIDTISGAGGGVAGVSGAVSVAVITNDTIAAVGDDSELDVSGQAKVLAESTETASTNTASAAGGGIAGVAGAVSVKVVNGTTAASLGNGVNVNQDATPATGDNADQRIDVIAMDKVDLDGKAGSAAVGTVGVGATADVNIVRNTVSALVGSNAKLSAAQDINVDTEADKNVDSTTVAAAGGLAVGVGGATSIIVLGAALDEDSQDSLKDSEGSGNNTASYVDGKITDDQASKDMGDSEHIQSSKTDLADRTAALNVSSDMNAVSADDKTLAHVGAATTLDAGRNIDISATDYTTATTKTGGTAVGSVGVGGAVGVTTITNNTEATVADGAILSAVNTLTVAAENTQRAGDTTIGAFGGAAGLVGVGAAVAYVDTNNSAIAQIGEDDDVTGVTISKAGSVNITASQDDDIAADATGAAVGGGAVGASLSRTGRDSMVKASLGRNATVGNSDIAATEVVSMNIAANSSGATRAKTIAGAAGTAFAGSGALAIATDNSSITAKTGAGAGIGVVGDVAVTATSKPEVSAESIGVSVAGGVKIGASASEAKSAQQVSAMLGAGNVITANNLLVKATNGLPASGYSVKADAMGAGGGLLLGLNATSGTAENTLVVDSAIGDSSSLTIANVLKVQALNSSKQRTDVSGINGGIVAAGFNEAEAKSDSDVDARIGNSVTIAGGALIIDADSTDNNYADSVAGSGGLVSGSASEANTHTVSNTTASVGNGSLARSIRVDSIDMDARHHSVFNSQVDSTNASLLGASGASARNVSVATVEAKLGSALDVETRSIDVDANNITTKADIWSVTSGSGGLLDAPAASSISTITNNTRVDVGADTAIVQLGEPDAAGAYEFDALNKVTAKDKVRMNAGGAVALAKGVSIIDANTNNASVNIGDRATLLAVGDAKMGTRAEAEIETKVAVDVYGVAGAPSGETRSSFKLGNQVSIGEDTKLYALKDVRLGAGVSSANEENNIKTKARTDLWNNTVVPINSDPEADAIIQSSNSIIIKDGADVAAVQDAYLLARQGTTSTSGVGLGKDIYREALAAVASAVSNAFGGDDVSFDIHGGSESNVSNSIVTVENNAVVRVGTEAKQKLQIDFLDANRTSYKTTKWINDVIVGSDKGIQIIAEDTFSIADDIRRRITELQDLISEYSIGTDNSGELAIAILAYENEIAFLEQKLEDLGYVPQGLGDDGNFKFTGATTLSELESRQLQVDNLSEERGEIVVDRDTAVVVRDDARDNPDTGYLALDAEKVSLDSDKATLDAELAALIAERDLLDPVDDKDAYDAKDAEVTMKDAAVTDKQGEIDTNVASRTIQFDIFNTKSAEVISLNDDIQGYDDIIDPIVANIDAGNVYGTQVPEGPTVTKLTIGDTVAQLGNINIEADRLQGSGTLRAPGDARIDIINNTNNFLELNDLIIPANDGGHIYYNDVDVTNTAQVDAINRPIPGTNVPSSLVLETSATSPTPEIYIESNYNPLDASNTSKAAELEAAGIPYANVGPDIIVKAGASPLDQTIISNTRGKVTIDSEAGNIRIERDSKISAATVQIETRSGDFVQSYSDAFSHIAGDPWLPEGSGASKTFSLNESQGVDPDDGSLAGIIANGSVLIAARYLNINGLIQSGIPEWGVTIASGAGAINPDNESRMTFEQAITHYKSLANPVEGDQFYDVFGTSTSGLGDEYREINVEFNARDQRLELSGIEVKGGYIDLFGQIMNTNDTKDGDTVTGKLRVLDGYGQIKVNNQSMQNLYVSTLDTGQGVEGKIKITNILGVDAGGKPVVDVQEFTRGGGARTGHTYNPQADLRYVQTVGTDKTTTISYKYEEDRLFGISALPVGSDLNQYKYDTKSVEDPLSTGEFLRFGNSNDPHDAITSNEYTTSATQRILGSNGSSCNFLCITTTYYQYFKDVTGTKEIDSYSVKADYGIDMEYIGHDNGVIDVTSKQDVMLAGSLLNRNGNTSVISTQGSILQTESSAAMGGNNVDLNAARSIGDSSQSIILANLNGGEFNATAGLGNIFVNQETGDMAIGTVSAAQGKVQLSVDGDITTPTGYIEGQRIDLTSRNGAIGEVFTPVNLRTGVTTVATEFADYGLVATARGDINIANTGGDLMIVAVESKSGDVTLTTTGKMIDNNLVERVDEETQAALVALWDEMRLRGPEAVEKADEEIQLMESSVTAEYRRYWNLREQQADPSSYDSAFEYMASDDEINLLSDYYTAQGKLGSEITEAVEKFEQDRTNEYHSLHQRLYDSTSDGSVQGVVAANYNPDFFYEATADEKSNRTDGSSWSDLQLALSVSPGLLKEITDTVPVIKDPNVKGNNVTLVAAEGIGSVDPLAIDLTKGLDALTDAEKAAIAAAERGDTIVVEDVLLDADGKPVVDALGNATQGLLEIARRKPVNIEHRPITGVLDATAITGDAYLGSEEDVRIGRIIAENEIRLKVAGGLESALIGTGAASVNITGQRLILEAAKGGIGNTDSPIIINLGADAPLTARAGDSIWLDAMNDDLAIDTVFTRSLFSLKTAGDVVEYEPDAGTDIRAASVVLEVGGAFGAGGLNESLDITLNPDGILLGTVAEGAFVTSPLQSLRIGNLEVGGTSVISSNQDIYLDSEQRELTRIVQNADGEKEEFVYLATEEKGLVSTAGTMTLIAKGSILDEDEGARAIEALELDLIARNGDIGAADNYLDIDVVGPQGVWAQAENGGIYIESPDSDLRLRNVAAGDDSVLTSSGDILLIQSGVGEYRSTGGTLAFEAEDSILDASGDSLIEAVDLSLQATNGTIGSAERSLHVDTDSISWLSAPKGIYLTEVSGDMNIGYLHNGTGDVVLHVAEPDAWLNISAGLVDSRMLWTADNMHVDNLVHGGNQEELYFEVTSSTGGMADDVTIKYQSDKKVRFANLEANRAKILGDVNDLKFDRVLIGEWGLLTNDTTSVFVDNTNSGLFKQYTIQLTSIDTPFFLTFVPDSRKIETGAYALYYDEDWIVNSFSTENSLSRLVEKDLAYLTGPVPDIESQAVQPDDSDIVEIDEDALNMQSDDDTQLFLPLFWSDI